MKKNRNTKTKFTFLIVLIFVYTALFEFILPVNKVLPKPSLLLEASISVWTDYHLLQALAITSTVIYISLLIGYFITVLKSSFIIRASYEFPGSIETLKLFRYFPPFFIAILFVFWFEDSIYAEFLFALIAVTFMLSNKLYSEAKNVKQEYLLVSKNLGIPQSKIYSKVVWKAVEPEVFRSLLNVHYFLWVIIMIYEFIGNIGGFGGVYRSALLFNDYSAFISVAILISIIIWLGNYVITLIYDKYFSWKQ